MKKIILSTVLVAAMTLSSLSTASAMSIDVYGKAKMNIWDFYLTENNAEKPDVITGATVDAVSQATYNMYDNLPVDITTAMDFSLLADCVIMDAQGLKNTSITKILQTWQEGYKTTLLGNSKTDITYPIDKSVVKVTLNEGKVLYVPYSTVANEAADSPEFSWNAFIKELAETAPSIPPYRVKYILETGEFGKGFLVSDADAKAAPALSLDETYNNDKANKNNRIKINFENNKDWANEVYAITVNGTGLISGETGNHASSTVINGETSFLKGSSAKNTEEFIIRLSQKFRIGDNTITVMAHGYEDAVLNIPVEDLSDWMVDATAKNQDTDTLLSENREVAQGAVILVESRMKNSINTPGEFSAVWIDGRLIPKAGGKDDATKYTQNGKALSYYTDDLAAGQHELRLKRLGHPDTVFQFTITNADKSEAPVFTLNREQLQDGSTAYQGGIVRGSDIILRSEAAVDGWFANIQKVFWIDSAGVQRDITTDYNRTIGDENKTVTIINKTFNYLSTEGNYTLLFKARGYGDVSLPVQIVRGMPSSNVLTYEQDGSVVLTSSDSTYLSKSKLKTVTINGTAYPVSMFTITTLSPYTMIIPSEYFNGGMKAVVTISADGYSDFIRTIDIPEGHKQRVYAPEVQLEQNRVLSGGNIVLNFTDDSSWREHITSVVYRPDNSTTDSKLTPDTATAGKLTMKAPTYTTGKGSLIIKAEGYRDVLVPIELTTEVPGTVTSEIQGDGSVSVAVSNSTYLGKVSVLVEGNTINVTKGTNKLTIPSSAFLTKKMYEVILQAEGYADYAFSVNTDIQTTPTVTAPVKPFEKQAFTVTSENSDWANKITGATLYYSTTPYVQYTKAADISVQDGNVTFAAKSMASSGNYTLKIYADGYLNTSVNITFVKAVPQGTLFEVSGDNVLLNVSDYSYRTAIQTIQVGNTTLVKDTDFSTGSNPISLSKSKFPQGDAAIAIYATGYGDYTTNFNLSAIKQPPVTQLEQNRVLSGGNIALTFTDDSPWREAIASAIFRPDSGSDRSLTLTKSEGKLTAAAPSTTGKGTLIIKATGYSDLTMALELVAAVPGTVTSELQSDGSLVVAVSSSTYLGKIAVTVNGNTVSVEKGSGKLTIPATAFPDKKAYAVVLKAEGYADYSFSVNTDAQDVPTLSAPISPLEKQTFTIASTDSNWAKKVTSAKLTDTYTSITYAASDIVASEEGNVTFAAKTSATAGSYTLKIYAEGYLAASMPITFVKAVPNVTLEAAEAGVVLNISDYSYRSSIQTIKIDGTVLNKGTDFSTSSNPVALDKSNFPAGQCDVVITATGYADYKTTFNISAINQAPEVTLPQEVALTKELVLTSNDGNWADAVTKVEIGKTYFSSLEASELTIEDGNITISASKLKGLLYVSAGTGYTIKIYADGYYTKQLSNITIYGKSSDDFNKQEVWEDGKLKINLSEGTSSYYYVGKVFVDEVEVTGLIKPSSGSKVLVIPAGSHFTEKIGESVTVRITGTTGYNLPDIILQIQVEASE
ncbi:DUF1533 domain-containing protein [Aminipila butyrica]|uniref:DUF1533 domain-containing protein n=1 Tax=Aminipila butyrica TaxID=433296 RepID=A0A858BXZ1_9FIRM|nr:hemoblobin-interacting domain-containing protein [Aminipila butyrica]QIB70457.1 DUF1533 domain-containing protein [Aminipila butyrica]